MAIEIGMKFENVKTKEIVKVIEINEKFKTCIVECIDGSTKSYSNTTIKDKRRWIPAEVTEKAAEVEETTNVKNDLVPMPGIEKLEETSEEIPAAPSEKPVKKRGVLISYDGKSQNICAWGKELGISPNTLYARIYNMGWSVEKAFTTKKGSK